MNASAIRDAAGDTSLSASRSPIIEATGLEKLFSGVHALRDVAFDLLPGEVHALMGENGAGKSTLMKVLAGVYQPDAGEVRVDGAPAWLDGPHAAQALGIGIIHQELNLAQHLTAAANVYLGREPRRMGVFVDEAKMRADALALGAPRFARRRRGSSSVRQSRHRHRRRVGHRRGGFAHSGGREGNPGDFRPG